MNCALEVEFGGERYPVARLQRTENGAVESIDTAPQGALSIRFHIEGEDLERARLVGGDIELCRFASCLRKLKRFKTRRGLLTMAENSKIEWTDHTFNPWWGCVKVTAGCTHCYADAFSKRTGHNIWGPTAPRRFFGAAHWNEPLKWNEAAKQAGERHRVFCASMADVFEELPQDHPQRAEMDLSREILFANVIFKTPHLDWLLLTKRPENILPWMQRASYPTEYSPLFEPDAPEMPPNVWIGATAENQEEADKRIPILLQIPAAIRFLSVEPMLGPVDLRSWLDVPPANVGKAFEGDICRDPKCRRTGPHYPGEYGCRWSDVFVEGGPIPGIDWVICGGESGPKARPTHPQWPRDLRDQCVSAGVPFLFKQWGNWLPISQTSDNESDEFYHPAPKRDPEATRRCKYETAILQLDGTIREESPPGAMLMFNVGKKRAGRLLDGREWNELPKVEVSR